MIKSVRCSMALFGILLILFTSCASNVPEYKNKLQGNAALKAHSAEFRKQVIKVTDGVYVAVGYGLANSILLVGKTGTVVVDTMENIERAIPVKNEFDKISQKPLKALIYTHFHPDHTMGARAFTNGKKIDVYSHASTVKWLDRIVTTTLETTYRRGMRQFGNMLPPGGVINDGIGPFLGIDAKSTFGAIWPTKTFSGKKAEYTIAGMKLVLIHAPGETPDQTIVWIPEKKVLLCGDNYYKSFPNLYAIRGTAYRDVYKWVKSLDLMRSLKPEFLVPSHTRPLTGVGNIYQTLTNYRDAIQFVHDQTIRWMNKGLTPDEIVEKVKLPPHLASLPYLQEYYGTVEWSARAIFDGYLGWFSGNATDLFPLSPEKKAKRFEELAGGSEALFDNAKAAIEQKDFQWAMVLADQLIMLDYKTNESRQIKAKAMTARGEKQIASTARNYYLTQALETTGNLTIKQRKTKEFDLVHNIPLQAIFNGLGVKLDPNKSLDVDKVVGFRFPDKKVGYTVHVRHGVAEIQPVFPENPEITVTMNSNVWKEIAAKMRSPAMSLVKGDISIKGGTFNLVSFLMMFDL